MAKRRTISLEQLDNMEVDDDNRLYWKGQRVQTDVTLTLPWLVNIAVILTGISTGGLLIVALLQAFGILPR